MSDNKYNWLSFIKKIFEFIRFIISFSKNKKELEAQKQKDRFNNVASDLKQKYDKIDNQPNKDDLNKRLKNIF